ncbi:MAG: diguanylate cyclase [Sulfurimonas sp.]|nr:diguanylate cyclase [Sulfurimonas sp.]
MSQIKIRLLLMLLPLLFSMSALGLYTFFEKYEQYKILNESSQTIKVSMKLSDLIHAIQLERGVSSSYLENYNLIYIEKMKSKRENTNSEFNLLMRSIDYSFSEIPTKKNIIDKEFKYLDFIRTNIDNGYKNIDIFKAYSDVITKYLQLINNLSYDVQNKMLAREYSAYLTLLWLQENAAKERGMLSSVFEAKKLDAKKHILVNEYTNKFNQLLDTFYHTAPLKYQKKLKKEFQQPVIKNVDKLIESVQYKIYRNYFINDLLPLLGFKGMIHNFKNYLIRGDENLIELFRKDYKESLNIIDKYATMQQFSDVDRDKILIIKNTIQKYAKMLPIIIKMKKEKKDTFEIDNMIQIDDLPAVNAINYLCENIDNISVDEWWKQSTQRIDIIKKISDEMQDDILKKSSDEKNSIAKETGIFLIITFIVALMSLVLGILIIRRAVDDLIKTTKMMNEMRKTGNYSYIFELKGSDELSDMQKAFNKLIEDRNEAELDQKLSAEVFNSINEGVVVLNAYMEIEAVNPAFSRITGYSFDEVKAKHYSILHVEDNNQLFHSNIENELKENGIWEGESNGRRKNGEIYPELLTISVIKDKNNNIIKYLKVFRDITLRKANEKKIFYQANYDELTGLANRNNGMSILEHELKVAKRNKSKLALMFIDLDGFKMVNDTFGHECGDIVLKEVSQRFLRVVREVDSVVRIGGDEFIIILPNIHSMSDLKRIAENIIEEIQYKFELKDEECDFISASIGISSYPKDATDRESLLKNADEMLYKIKERGKNNYMLYSDDI